MVLSYALFKSKSSKQNRNAKTVPILIDDGLTSRSFSGNSIVIVQEVCKLPLYRRIETV
jgi:hypothetical protein